MKLSEEVEPRLEVVASEPRLDVREPRLLPEEQDRVLADRLEGETGWKGGTWQKESSETPQGVKLTGKKHNSTRNQSRSSAVHPQRNLS